jgi:uncharacterized protein YbjT (DUF2867 family)
MDRSDKTILVTGGTGRQGGAAARHVLADGWHVRALVRDPEKPAARELARAGAELVVGDLTNRASLDAAVAGAYGVHSMQTFREAGFDGEVAEGTNLADAAAAAGVRHFVYVSVFGADSEEGAPWVMSKRRIEAHVRETGMPCTIWRPVTFMEDFFSQRGDIRAGHLRTPNAADWIKQMIAVDDIGKFVALAFRDPEPWTGKATEIAGDAMPWTKVAEVFSRVLGRPVVYETIDPRPGMPTPQPPRMIVDIEALRESVPDLTSLADWVRRTFVSS